MAVVERDPTEKWEIPSFSPIEQRRKEKGMTKKDLSLRAGFAAERYQIILNNISETNPYISSVRSFCNVVFDSPEEYYLPTISEMYHTCGDLSLCPRKISQDAGYHPRTFENDVKKDVDPHLHTYRSIIIEIIEADPADHPDETEYGLNSKSSRMSDVIGSDDFLPEDIGLSPLGDR